MRVVVIVPTHINTLFFEAGLGGVMGPPNPSPMDSWARVPEVFLRHQTKPAQSSVRGWVGFQPLRENRVELAAQESATERCFLDWEGVFVSDIGQVIAHERCKTRS
jgi:hypothetical protein